MHKQETVVHIAEILDDHAIYSLQELCEICGIPTELIFEMIDHGILEPTGKSQKEWQFTTIAIRRSRTVVHLQNDLGINMAGAALALDLLDEIRGLERRLKLLD